MPGYAAEPFPQTAVPGTVVTDPWDDELESVIAELQALQQAREQMAGAGPEQVRYPMPSDDVPMGMRNALAGGGEVGPAADNALAFDPDPRVNPYMSLRTNPGRYTEGPVIHSEDPYAPVRRVERTDPLAMEQHAAGNLEGIKNISGYSMGRAGVRNIGEGAAAGDPLRVAGGAGQVGLAALPFAAPFRAARALYSTPTRTGGMITGGLAADPLAKGTVTDLAGSFFGTPAEAQTVKIGPRAAAAAARAKAEAESRGQLAVEKQRADEARKATETETAERIRQEGVRKAQEEQTKIDAQVTAAKDARDKIINEARRPFEQAFTDQATWQHIVPMGLAAVTTAAIPFANALAKRADLKNWWNAVTAAQGARAGSTVQQRNTAIAQGYAEQYPKGFWNSLGRETKPYMIPMGVGATEGAAVANIPEFYDWYLPAENPERTAYLEYIKRLPPGHSEVGRAREILEDIPEMTPARKAAAEHFESGMFLKRMGTGAWEGAVGSMIPTSGVKLIPPYSMPHPETAALARSASAKSAAPAQNALTGPTMFPGVAGQAGNAAPPAAASKLVKKTDPKGGTYWEDPATGFTKRIDANGHERWRNPLGQWASEPKP